MTTFYNTRHCCLLFELHLSCSLGTIKENLGNCAYLVQDSTDALEKIWREDIIAESDDADVTLQVCVKLAFIILKLRYFYLNVLK